ncbi:hypothetical protein U1Q18_046330 [Sarracenia purpurea var. burkii]
MDFLDSPFSLVFSILLSLFSLILGLLIFQTFFRKLDERREKKKYHPIGDTVFNLLLNFKRMHDYITDLAKKHKTFRLIRLFKTIILTSDPANVEYILKTNFHNFGKKTRRKVREEEVPSYRENLDFKQLDQSKCFVPYHPIGGTVFNQLVNFNRLHNYITDLAKKHKTFRLIKLLKIEIHTSDLTNVEYILKTNFHNFGKGPYNSSVLGDLLGDGIFAVDGEKWHEQRKLSSYEFLTKILREFSSAIFQKNAVKLVNIVSDSATSNHVIDIQDLFMKSTLDSIFNVGFGIELDSICGSSKEGTTFNNAFDDANALSFWRYIDVFWKIKRALNIGSEALLKKKIKIVDDFVYKQIRSKTEQMNKSPNDSSIKREDILSRFLQVSETNPKYLRDIILNLVIAGKDTTATTLSWFIYMMCKHPAVQEKIANEIKEATKVKRVTDFGEFAASICEEALEKMQYLHAALTETLRLYPAIPMDIKSCFSDDTLPDGFSVRKGDLVVYLPFAMGRMRFLWGDDAEDYRPERWLDDNGIFKPESPFKFTAFQAGPRICLGKEFAYRQMKIISAMLLGCFVFKLDDETKSVNYRLMITLNIRKGLYVCAFPRLHV